VHTGASINQVFVRRDRRINSAATAQHTQVGIGAKPSFWSVPAKDHQAKDHQCTDTNRATCSTDCNRASPRCNTTAFMGKVNGPWIPCCEKKQFHEMLLWFNNIVLPHVDTTGNDFWYSIVFGTLLGSERGGDMIDWDTDMDVVVPNEKISWLENLLAEAAAKEVLPYHVHLDRFHVPHAPTDIHVLRLSLSKTNSGHMDIWGTDASQPCVQIGSHISENYGPFPLEWCTLGNAKFPCFAHKQQFLKAWYGDAWHKDGTNKFPSARLALPAECSEALAEAMKFEAAMTIETKNEAAEGRAERAERTPYSVSSSEAQNLRTNQGLVLAFEFHRERLGRD